MIPKIFKLNRYAFTRIPRPSELYQRAGFSQVRAKSLYDDEASSVNLRKIDALKHAIDEVNSIEDSSE